MIQVQPTTNESVKSENTLLRQQHLTQAPIDHILQKLSRMELPANETQTTITASPRIIIADPQPRTVPGMLFTPLPKRIVIDCPTMALCDNFCNAQAKTKNAFSNKL